MTKGARPIVSSKIKHAYDLFKFNPVSIWEYTEQWKQWLSTSQNKKISGLDSFGYGAFVNGTSQAFDHFWLRHSDRRLICLPGEFQYHSCIGKKLNFCVIGNDQELTQNDALVISLPFSDLGTAHPELNNILNTCNQLNIPVCIDLAYWGIAKNISIDLDQYPCVEVLTSSLSKSFYSLENHRVGVRFTRNYLDDGIDMINEVHMQNNYSMSIGKYFMEKFSNDWNWDEFGDSYKKVCERHALISTNTVIFGLSSDPIYQSYQRGIPNNYRICISDSLSDINNLSS
jgi:hypothetical protein